MIYFHHPYCQKHRTPPGHPERVERITALETAVRQHAVQNSFYWREAHEASREDLLRVHTEAYLDFLESRCAEAVMQDPAR